MRKVDHKAIRVHIKRIKKDDVIKCCVKSDEKRMMTECFGLAVKAEREIIDFFVTFTPHRSTWVIYFKCEGGKNILLGW